MKGLPPAAGKGVPGPVRQCPFSQLVYTNNDSYIVRSGDLKKIHKAASLGQVRKLEKVTKRKKTINLNIKDAKKSMRAKHSSSLEKAATRHHLGRR
ncbi:ankyrin repeat domain-containing protein 30A-like isoform X2 [Hylobates moloch]|uniref:ankyrin repeat domain-containing protein 30A-like isoform X2 n=1 Tax=Hylobates moloch TaxID=81572 RepID=UPI002674F252|nr:ankyrin repeat domain-containing protein 30A-like isoform X2 [Hylobates moloch]